jgi:hypothetical protein
MAFEPNGTSTESVAPDFAQFTEMAIGADGAMYVGARPCCSQPIRILAFR